MERRNEKTTFDLCAIVFAHSIVNDVLFYLVRCTRLLLENQL